MIPSGLLTHVSKPTGGSSFLYCEVACLSYPALPFLAVVPLCKEIPYIVVA